MGMTFKMEERTLVEEVRVEVPPGATHYEGSILGDPYFYKIVELADCSPPEKFILFWDTARNKWKHVYILPTLREIKFASEQTEDNISAQNDEVQCGSITKLESNLTLNPGDILVIKSNQNLSNHQIKLIRRQFEKSVPKDTKILVIDAGFELRTINFKE